ncbi:phosphatase [Mangrovimicrobium sediminis]|uniref:Phosphatase n=1 Tax=Mangrovimicrobium sediminis TaxID=2562682 RepID=A0A4Z0LZT4_9GAMM|nr:protein tyrosine phosphatase family protein [Haliea sp. SAOS-164]TGD72730.1 phosphatase [Haliea sp. SAOS-164]
MHDWRNYLQIDDWLHTAGQPDAGQLATLGALGIRHVINLALPDSDNAVADEARIVAAQGIDYLNIPVDFENPTRAQFELFCTCLDAVAGEPTLVHCAYNMRVSAFVYLYRVTRCNLAPEEARQALLQLWEPSGVWAAFVESCLAAWEDPPR